MSAFSLKICTILLQNRLFSTLGILVLKAGLREDSCCAVKEFG